MSALFPHTGDATPSSRSLLRGKEQRSLREALVKRLPGAGDEGALDVVLGPAKAGLESLRYAGGRVAGYGPVGGACAFLDLDPKAAAPWRLLPTLAGALWRAAPGARPLLNEVLIPPHVSAYVLRGADLMLPGVLLLRDGALGPFAEGELLAVRVAGNPAPIAVGEALVSSADALRGGMRGRGVRVLHYFGDALWAASGRVVPNAGFAPGDRIDAIGWPEPLLGEGSGAAAGGGGGATSPPSAAADPAALSAGAAALARWAAATPDALLEATLLQCLSHSRHVHPRSLPMLANVLFGGAFARARPVGTELDPKRTSWKRFGEFLKAQAACGLVEIDGEGGGRLLGWDAAHPKLLAHRDAGWPESAEAGHVSNASGAGVDAGAAAAAAGGGGDASLGGSAHQWAPPVVASLLRPPPACARVITTVLLARVVAPGAVGKAGGGKGGKGAAAAEDGALGALPGAEPPVVLPGLVLTKRSAKRGGGAAANARLLATRLTPMGDVFAARAAVAAQRAAALLLGGVAGGGEEEGDSGSDGSDSCDGEGGGGEGTGGEEGGGADAAPTGAAAAAVEGALAPAPASALPTSTLLTCLPPVDEPGAVVLFTLGEASALLADYVALRKLGDPASKGNIRLDVALAEALAGDAGKARRSDAPTTAEGDADGSLTTSQRHLPLLEATPPGRSAMARIAPLRVGPDAAAGELRGAPSLPREDVLARWLARFVPWFALTHRTTSGGGGFRREVVARAGAPPVVRVGHKLVQGKRSLTWVVGAEAYRIEPRALAQDLQRLLAASATLQNAAPLGIRFEGVAFEGGGGDVLAVCVQGELVERVVAHLTGTCGLPKSCVIAEAVGKVGKR